jgi:hypothetical protein
VSKILLKIPINASIVVKKEISSVVLILQELIHPLVTLKNNEYVAKSLREAQ